MKTPIELGQSLFLSFTRNSGHGMLREYVVTKIGHKWIQVGTLPEAPGELSRNPNVHRVAISDMIIDGGAYSSPGIAYSSREEYEALVARSLAWSTLQDYMRAHYNAPSNLSDEAIEAALVALGLTP